MKFRQQQQLQLEKENRNKFDFKDYHVESASSPSRSRPIIDSFQRENNTQQKEESPISQDSARSNHQIVPNSPNQNNGANESLKRRNSVNKLSNSSDSDKEPLRNRSSSDSNAVSAIDNKPLVSVPRPIVKTVRISSVVENIETKKTYPLENSVCSTLEADEIESDEEKKDPYELTKPQAKIVAVNNYEPPEYIKPSNQRKSSFGNNEANNATPNYQPKVKYQVTKLSYWLE